SPPKDRDTFWRTPVSVSAILSQTVRSGWALTILGAYVFDGANRPRDGQKTAAPPSPRAPAQKKKGAAEAAPYQVEPERNLLDRRRGGGERRRERRGHAVGPGEDRCGGRARG